MAEAPIRDGWTPRDDHRRFEFLLPREVSEAFTDEALAVLVGEPVGRVGPYDTKGSGTIVGAYQTEAGVYVEVAFHDLPVQERRALDFGVGPVSVGVERHERCRLEFGWVMEDGRYICDGCGVRPGHEHRCHGSDGAWADGRSCECKECEDWKGNR